MSSFCIKHGKKDCILCKKDPSKPQARGVTIRCAAVGCTNERVKGKRFCADHGPAVGAGHSRNSADDVFFDGSIVFDPKNLISSSNKTSPQTSKAGSKGTSPRTASKPVITSVTIKKDPSPKTSKNNSPGNSKPGSRRGSQTKPHSRRSSLIAVAEGNEISSDTASSVYNRQKTLGVPNHTNDKKQLVKTGGSGSGSGGGSGNSSNSSSNHSTPGKTFPSGSSVLEKLENLAALEKANDNKNNLRPALPKKAPPSVPPALPSSAVPSKPVDSLRKPTGPVSKPIRLPHASNTINLSDLPSTTSPLPPSHSQQGKYATLKPRPPAGDRAKSPAVSSGPASKTARVTTRSDKFCRMDGCERMALLSPEANGYCSRHVARSFSPEPVHHPKSTNIPQSSSFRTRTPDRAPSGSPSRPMSPGQSSSSQQASNFSLSPLSLNSSTAISPLPTSSSTNSNFSNTSHHPTSPGLLSSSSMASLFGNGASKDKDSSSSSSSSSSSNSSSSSSGFSWVSNFFNSVAPLNPSNGIVLNGLDSILEEDKIPDYELTRASTVVDVTKSSAHARMAPRISHKTDVVIEQVRCGLYSIKRLSVLLKTIIEAQKLYARHLLGGSEVMNDKKDKLALDQMNQHTAALKQLNIYVSKTGTSNIKFADQVTADVIEPLNGFAHESELILKQLAKEDKEQRDIMNSLQNQLTKEKEESMKAYNSYQEAVATYGGEKKNSEAYEDSLKVYNTKKEEFLTKKAPQIAMQLERLEVARMKCMAETLRKYTQLRHQLDLHMKQELIFVKTILAQASVDAEIEHFIQEQALIYGIAGTFKPAPFDLPTLPIPGSEATDPVG